MFEKRGLYLCSGDRSNRTLTPLIQEDIALSISMQYNMSKKKKRLYIRILVQYY